MARRNTEPEAENPGPHDHPVPEEVELLPHTHRAPTVIESPFADRLAEHTHTATGEVEDPAPEQLPAHTHRATGEAVLTEDRQELYGPEGEAKYREAEEAIADATDDDEPGIDNELPAEKPPRPDNELPPEGEADANIRR